MLLWERIYSFKSEYFRFREGKLAIRRPSYCLPGPGPEPGRVNARAQPGISWGSMVAMHGGTEGCVGCGVCVGRTAETLTGYELAWHGMEAVHEGLREWSQSLVGSTLGAQ